MYLNKALLIGNLTRDPEMRSLPSGVKVTSFSLATNRVWKDKDGNRQENTDYHNIVVFGKQAETVAQYLKKGSSALVEGRMQTRSWDAQDGSKKYRTEIIADRIQFGPRREGGTPAPTTPASKDKEPQPEAEAPGGGIDYPQEEINPDDIPF
ncbi:MAG: single-stranded DNA-binding protein [Patescibacteria group bacterium]|nr:single-stranded DNA-binding protein [bacterium]MDZ4241029.1 single-stranded DNA-binding protein [Patescibacteria group bacterium]